MIFFCGFEAVPSGDEGEDEDEDDDDDDDDGDGDSGEKSLMLTEVTTPITFLEVFHAVRAEATMEVGQGRDQEEIAGHRRHGEMLFETPPRPNDGTTPRSQRVAATVTAGERDEGGRNKATVEQIEGSIRRSVQVTTLMPGRSDEEMEGSERR